MAAGWALNLVGRVGSTMRLTEDAGWVER